MSTDGDYKLGCPCGYRPPRTDDLDAWNSWYDHLAEMKEAHRAMIAAAGSPQ